VSSPTFLAPQTSTAAGPQTGAIGPQTGATGPQTGALGTSAQVDTGQQLNQLIAQQAAAEQQKEQQPDKSGTGWSWNLFQDVGQVWHDVETHTIAPALHAMNWLTTNLVERPITTAELYAGHMLYQSGTGNPNYSILQGSNWQKAWNDSATVSPTEGLVLAADANRGSGTALQSIINQFPGPVLRATDPLDKGVQKAFGTAYDPMDKTTQTVGTFDPYATQNRAFRMGGDFALDWFANPVNKAAKLADVAKLATGARVLKTDTQAQALAKLNSPASQQFNEWAMGKTIAEIANHPIVKGSGTVLNANVNKMAALIADAKSPEEIGLIRQVAAGIVGPSEAASTVASIAAATASTSAAALDRLATVNKNTAFQVVNALLPRDLGMKFALMPGSEADRGAFLEQALQVNAKMAQEDINANADRWKQIVDLRASYQGATKSTQLTNRLAELRGQFKYANTRDVDGVFHIRNAYYNLPVRFYQGLVDRTPGLLNHRDDHAVDQVRAWLNKSSSLTPDEKIAHVQAYATATPADRAHVWNTIENRVYKQVGDKYGLDSDAMSNLLQTTRTRAGYYTRAAVSRAFGETKLPNGESHAIIPSAESAVILHPMLITQLEAGAQPMANLKNLENALDRMDKTGLLSTVRNTGQHGKDLLYTLLDKVYGIWKPLSLMTGHRVYNHVGDDGLRGASLLGGAATVDNLSSGAANFLYNRYAQLSNNQVVRNLLASRDKTVTDARAAYEGIAARYKSQKVWNAGDIPDELLVTPEKVAAAKQAWQNAKNAKLPEILDKHRLGEGTFKIPGSNLTYDEAFAGSDYMRYATSSHQAFMSTVDEAADLHQGAATVARSRNFAPIRAVDNLDRHTAAYVHYIRNQLMPDPVAKQIVQGKDLNAVAEWLSKSAQGQAHIRALHIGDPNDWVDTLAEMVKTYLPFDGMRDEAIAGKFNTKTIENYMPSANQRPDIVADITATLHGGDQTVGVFKKTVDTLMKWTGTLPDDIMVRHPVFNSLYKARMTDRVQSVIAQTGRDVMKGDELNTLSMAAMKAARNDMRNVLYDVSRFNDMGHTLRFISPFFNAWWNAMSSWSKLIVENPGLLARGYAAKRALWEAPFAIDTTTGQPSTKDTPLENVAFVTHMPFGLGKKLGGLGDIPISAKSFVSPTYVDSIGNPGFGPLVSVPLNQYVLSHPELLRSSVVKGVLNNMVDKQSLQQLLPSAVTDMGQLLDIFSGSPTDSSNMAKNMYSLWQEQTYDYYNGKRASKPQWSDIENQAAFLTVMDLFVNRMMPLGFKPARSHEYLVQEYRNMQSQDPANATQNFYDKHGAAAMVFTQGLSTDPSGIAATVGASAVVNKYTSLLSKHPELGGVIVGPEGNGNYDQAAYNWQVAKGLRKMLSPQEAASHAMINMGWAAYGKATAAIQAQAQAQGFASYKDAGARQLRDQLTAWVGQLGDPNSPAYNPDWYGNYTSFNQNAYEDRISALLTIAQDKALLSNPHRSDIRSLQAYSQLRDWTYAQLQANGGGNLQTAKNSSIAQQYDQQVSQMIQADTKFAQLYERYLAKDDWKEPV
jgi:hypothetical protein